MKEHFGFPDNTNIQHCRVSYKEYPSLVHLQIV